jgi:hypothetical protein
MVDMVQCMTDVTGYDILDWISSADTSHSVDEYGLWLVFVIFSCSGQMLLSVQVGLMLCVRFTLYPD